ncbi:endosomal protein P24B precursor [Apiospora arundinis]
MADETGKFRFPGRAVRALFASNEGRDAPEMAYSETMSRHPPPQMVDGNMDQPMSTVGPVEHIQGRRSPEISGAWGGDNGVPRTT